MLTLPDVTVGQELPDLEHEVTATTIVLGAVASRDYRPMHHDRSFAIDHNGVRDIFMNTPTQAGWFARYISDWTGGARLGEMKFRMVDPIFPGDRMRLVGSVTRVGEPRAEFGWVELALRILVDGIAKSTCTAAVAVPVSADADPWLRRGDQWRPFSDEE